MIPTALRDLILKSVNEISAELYKTLKISSHSWDLSAEIVTDTLKSHFSSDSTIPARYKIELTVDYNTTTSNMRKRNLFGVSMHILDRVYNKRYNFSFMIRMGNDVLHVREYKK